MKTISPLILGLLISAILTWPARAEITESNVVFQLKVYDQLDQVDKADLRLRSYKIEPYNTARVAQLLATQKGKLVSNKALIIRSKDSNQFEPRYLIRDKGQNDIDITSYFYSGANNQTENSKASISKGTFQSRIMADGIYNVAVGNNQEGFYLKGPMQISFRGVASKDEPGAILILYSQSISGSGHCITSPQAGSRLVIGTLKYTPPKILKKL